MNTQKYKKFQPNYLLHQFEFRQKRANRLEETLSIISCCLEKDLSSIDYMNVKNFLYDMACRAHKNSDADSSETAQKTERRSYWSELSGNETKNHI